MYDKQISFRKLLTHLHATPFSYIIPRDHNRAEDGADLRRRYIISRGYEDWYSQIMDELYSPCSILEMMVALAIRCEEDTMDDPSIGGRSKQWFWGMIRSLGLNSMMDHAYDETYVCQVIERFLNREYEPNGKGGLFTIRNCEYDLRDVEIWYQLNWYLDTIV